MNYRAAFQTSRTLSPAASRLCCGLVAAAAITVAPAVVHAQSAPAPAAPPVYAPPPGSYPQGYAPPPAYGPPPGYALPPGYAPPPGYYVSDRGPMVVNNWNEDQPVPAGWHVVVNPRRGLIIGGAVTFGVLYGLTATISALAGAGVGVIPVAGPFALIPSTGGNAGVDFVLVLDGLAQAAGVAMFIAGFAAPQKTLLRNDVFIGGLTLKPTPMSFGRNGAGFGLLGTF